MRPTLSTARLRLEPATEAHLPMMVELNSDPGVMTFLMGRAATPEETYDEWARRLGPQTDEARGLGYWAGFEGDVFVGWWSASSFAWDASQSGIGYRLRRDGWGRGLATEGARATIDHAFRVPGIERVVASTMAVNTASRRVMEKVGMSHVSTWHEEWDDPLPGSDQGEVGYELTRAQYRVARADARSNG
jgi:RimJ/RimL family protein N-acetyltransferase